MAMYKTELIKRIISLVNQINRKLKSFRDVGLGEMYEHEMDKVSFDINRKIDFTLPSGNFSKAKKQLEKLDERLLSKTFNNLVKLHTHESLRTVKNYQKYVLSPRLAKAYETMCKRYGEENVQNTFGGRKPTDQELISYLESCHKDKAYQYGDSGQKIETKVYEKDEEKEKIDSNDKAFSERETSMRMYKGRGKAMR